ncbi:MAG: hypothetical protein U1E77_13895 [Inhella sp.]
MHRSWTEVRRHFSELPKEAPWAHGLISLIDHVMASPLAADLYPWTSVIDLCIAQAPPSPAGNAPYLRVSPLPSGQLEFRYVDTIVSAQQWVRVVAPDVAVNRFDSFVGQLHWLRRAS